MSVMMEVHEWRAVFAALPEPTLEELALFIERRRAESEEELREFDRKWEGRTVTKVESGKLRVEGNADEELTQRRGDAEEKP